MLHRLALASALVIAMPAAHALTPSLVGSGYNVPVFLTAPKGDKRLFVVEKGGVIKSQTANGPASVFLNISALVDAAGERGLLGLAFDPNYASNGRFYVNYIDKTTLHTVVASFTAPNPASGAADPNSRKTIITIAQPAGRSNHKAGWIGFSPKDGNNLYIATGDGGGGNDPDNRAQNLNDNLGKMLRITPLAGGGYTVPAGNPLVGVAGNDEIWSYGLRNPYRNSFDRQTGDLWIADVGQGAREEVNFAASGLGGGANYGWRLREGSIATPGVGGSKPPGNVDPLLDYGRDLGGSIIGGYVVRNSKEAALNGLYLFGDYVSGRLFTVSQGNPAASFRDRSAEFGNPFGRFSLTSFGEDGFGSVYATTGSGQLYLLAGAVSEPASWALMLGGLGLLAGRRLRG
jgi:Glucose / Sorbosone dehydrogenase